MLSVQVSRYEGYSRVAAQAAQAAVSVCGVCRQPGSVSSGSQAASSSTEPVSCKISVQLSKETSQYPELLSSAQCLQPTLACNTRGVVVGDSRETFDKHDCWYQDAIAMVVPVIKDVIR